jgi:hypothetical protein
VKAAQDRREAFVCLRHSREEQEIDFARSELECGSKSIERVRDAGAGQGLRGASSRGGVEETAGIGATFTTAERGFEELHQTSGESADLARQAVGEECGFLSHR